MTKKEAKSGKDRPECNPFKKIETALQGLRQTADATFAQILRVEGQVEAIASELRRQIDERG